MDMAFFDSLHTQLTFFKVTKVHKSVGGGGAAELQR